MLIFFTSAFPQSLAGEVTFWIAFNCRWSALVSSLILGAIWGCGSCPCTLSPAPHSTPSPSGSLWPRPFVVTVAYTWLYNNTGGSILVAMLFHAMNGFTAAVIPLWTSDIGRWIHLAILLLLLSHRAYLGAKDIGSKKPRRLPSCPMPRPPDE